MKRISLFFVAAISSMLLNAQAPVPTSWDCETTTPPTGWTMNVGTTNQFYSAASACAGNASLRLDATNESLVIYLADQPGTVSYQIMGKTSGSPWNGTFVVQESINGTSWTTFKTYTGSGAMDVSGCTAETATPTDPASRYIRFFFQNKISGSNVAIDDISVAIPSVTSATIKVNQNSISGPAIIANGVTQPVGSSVGTGVPIVLALSNIGTAQTLNISNITITGANASDFTFTPAFPINISPSSNTNFTITFTPSASGTRIATCAITSNSATNPTFTFTLYGVGGALATEPSASAGNVTFNNVKSYRYGVLFGAASPAPDALGGYLVLRKTGSAVTETPVDGTVYRRGMSIGNAKVVYVATGNMPLGFVPLDIIANTTYHFAVYTFNGAGQYINYRTISPATGNVTTLGSMMPASEYSTVQAGSTDFISQLKAVINPHTSIFYGNYASTMINKFVARDTFVTVGSNTFDKYVDCSYSTDLAVYNEPFDWTAMDWSREHTYPHSWMPSFPADNPEKPEYNDQHNLYPARQTNVNALRCNYPLGDVVTATTSYNGCKLGTDAAGNKVFEPRSAHKGRAARALMYMATSYHSPATSWAFPNPIGNCSGTAINYGQDQYTVKKWHFDNPPTNFDIARNDFLDSLQTNRNPFADSIRYACFIDFTNMSLWQPAIVQIGAELQTEQGITTQWYLNGSLISGANSQSFTPTVNGTYTVKLKQFAPCPEIESKQLIVTNFSVENSGKTNANMVIFPNPNKGEYTLKVDAPKAGKAIVSIIDVGGRAIISGNYNLTEGVNNIQMNHTLSVGTYFLKIESNSLNQTEIFVVQ